MYEPSDAVMTATVRAGETALSAMKSRRGMPIRVAIDIERRRGLVELVTGLLEEAITR